MKTHWIISFALAIPGMALYRAISSEFLVIEDVYLRMGLQILGVSMGVAGLCFFLYMSKVLRQPKATGEQNGK